MIRIFLFLVFFGILLGLIFLVRKIMQPGNSILCSRCEGKGFWLAARGRETCDWCKGAGRLPRI